MLAANSIEDTEVKVVVITVRIARAEYILGIACKIQDMQKMTALLQVIDRSE